MENRHATRAKNPSGTIVLRDSVRLRQPIRITVDGELESAVGEPLRREAYRVLARAVRTQHQSGFASGLVTTPRDAAVLMRVRHMNTDSLTVVIGRVPDSLRARALAQGDPEFNYYGGLRWPDAVRGLPSYAPFPPRHRKTAKRVIDLPRCRRSCQRRGVTIRSSPFACIPSEKWQRTIASSGMLPRIVVRAPPDRVTPRYAVIRRSNLAVHVRATEGTVDVWVTALRDASARSGASVRLVDNTRRILATAVTDAQGRAQLRNPSQTEVPRGLFHVEVTHGDDNTLLPLGRGAADRYAPANDDEPTQNYWGAIYAPARIGTRWLHGTAFTDRGIYRPGERVHFGGAARTFRAGGGDARFPLWTPRNGRCGSATTRATWIASGRMADASATSTPLADSFTIGRTARLGEYPRHARGS